jgi:hypothetical protein
VTFPPIIGLNGVARAGKDTVGGILHDLYGYEIKSFSDILNQALIALNPIVVVPWEVDVPGLIVAGHEPYTDLYIRYADLAEQVGYEAAKEVPEVRALLQRMGTEVGRDLLGADIWVDALFKRIEPRQKIAIVNVRFPNEYRAVRNMGGEVWRVDRPGYDPAQGHLSDRALEGYDFDAVILNDGSIRDLANKVMNRMDNPTVRALQDTFR